MKKILWIAVAVVVVAVVATVLFMDSIVKGAVNTIGPQIAKTEVKVDSVNIGAFSGDFDLKGLKVANPKGFSDGNVLAIKKVEVEVEMSTLLKDVIVIDKIEVDGAEFMYELAKGTSNLTTLMNNIKSFSKSEGKTSAEGGKSKAAEGEGDVASKKVFIKKFVFTDAKLGFGAGISKENVGVSLDIPNLTLTNIGSEEKGVAIADAVAQAFAAFSASAMTVVASDSAKQLMKGGEGVMGTIKGWFE